MEDKKDRRIPTFIQFTDARQKKRKVVSSQSTLDDKKKKRIGGKNEPSTPRTVTENQPVNCHNNKSNRKRRRALPLTQASNSSSSNGSSSNGNAPPAPATTSAFTDISMNNKNALPGETTGPIQTGENVTADVTFQTISVPTQQPFIPTRRKLQRQPLTISNTLGQKAAAAISKPNEQNNSKPLGGKPLSLSSRLLDTNHVKTNSLNASVSLKTDSTVVIPDSLPSSDTSLSPCTTSITDIPIPLSSSCYKESNDNYATSAKGGREKESMRKLDETHNETTESGNNDNGNSNNEEEINNEEHNGSIYNDDKENHIHTISTTTAEAPTTAATVAPVFDLDSNEGFEEKGVILFNTSEAPTQQEMSDSLLEDEPSMKYEDALDITPRRLDSDSNNSNVNDNNNTQWHYSFGVKNFFDKIKNVLGAGSG